MAQTHSLDLAASSSQYAYHADAAAFDITGDLTIELWVKPESQPATGTFQALVSKASGTGGSYFLGYREDGGGGVYYLYFGVVTSSTFYTGQKLQTLSNGTWYHVAAVYTSSTGVVEFFVNGSSIGTANTFGGAIDNSSNAFGIGCMGANSGSITNYFDGLVDEVRLWNDKRTGTELNDNKSLEIDGASANLAACYGLNNDYEDRTSNNNDLTGSGSPTFSTDTPWTESSFIPNVMFI